MVFAALIAFASFEKNRFSPFYRDVECLETGVALKMAQFSLPPKMLPPGVPSGLPPFGLFGSVANTTGKCRNPNQVKVITRKADFKADLYLPDMSNWTWGFSEHLASSGKTNGSYIHVARVSLKEDYILPADGHGTAVTETTADAPLANFLGFMRSAVLVGYAPLYTKTVVKAKACVKLFGIPVCDAKQETVWCGTLAGNCLAPTSIGGMEVWAPGLCGLTRTVCRSGGDKGEAEMKAAVTADKLGLSTVPFPCQPASGMPPNMTCPVARAPGINATGHQMIVPGFIDGPKPDIQDLQKNEDKLNMFTNTVIVVGAVCLLCSCICTPCLVRWMLKPQGPKTTGAAASQSVPTVLTSSVEGSKELTAVPV